MASGVGAAGELALGAVTAGAVYVAAEDYKNSQITSNSAYNTVTNTIYPTDLVNSPAGRNYTITFYFYQYVRPSVNIPVYGAPQGSITLPLPTRLIDGQQMGFSEKGESLAFGAAFDAYLKTGSANAGFTGLVQGISAQAASNITNKLLKGTVLNNPVQTGLQLGGLAQNPYLTVLFDQPSFKRHTFTWTFAPVNIQESNTLKYIINKLRYHQLAAVSPTASGALLQYPDMCKPAIYPTGFMYDFKNCVIERMETNFAPGVTPGFHGSSNAPSVITVTISLLEIEIWLKSDLISQAANSNYSVTTNSQTTTGIN